MRRLASFWRTLLTAGLIGCGLAPAAAQTAFFNDDVLRYRAIIARFKADPQFELPKLVPCLEQLPSLTGQSPAALQDRCGPWQQAHHAPDDAARIAVTYRRTSGQLLMQVHFVGGVVSSAVSYLGF